MKNILMTGGRVLGISGTLPTISLGNALSTTMTGYGTYPPFAFSLVSDDLPETVTLVDNGDNTFTLTCASCDTPGTFDIAVRIRDAQRGSVIRTMPLRVVTLPLEVSGTLPPMTVGTPYYHTLPIVGGVAPYTLPLVIGAIAAVSVYVSGTNVVYDGTPTGANLGPGTSFAFDMGFWLEDSASPTTNIATFLQEVVVNVPVVSLPGDYDDGQIGVVYSDTLTATGGVGGPYTYTVAAGSLPPGLSLNGATGALTGTPTGTAATHGFTLRATDSEGNYADNVQSVVIAAAATSVVVTGTFPDIWEGLAYDQTLPITGGNGSYTITASANVPAGLTLAISGTNLRLYGTASEGTSSLNAYSTTATVADTGSAPTYAFAQTFTVQDTYGPLVPYLLHMNGINGASTNVPNFGGYTSVPWTLTGATYNTSNAKFGTASISVPSNGHIAGSGTHQAIGTEDFTIEFEWKGVASIPATYGRFLQVGQDSTAGGLYLVKTNSSSDHPIFVQTYASGAYHNAIDPAAATTISSATAQAGFTHIALTRVRTGSNYVYRLFFNGTLVASKTQNNGANLTTTNLWGLMNCDVGNENQTGYIDEFRVTIGKARYTASFTRPAKAHPNPIYFAPPMHGGLTAWLDFTDASKLYQNNTATTLVTADNQPLHAIANKRASNTQNWIVNNTSSTDATYQTNEVNGRSVLRMLGTQVNYFTPSNTIASYIASGAKTLTLVFKYTGSPAVTSPIYTGHAIFGGQRNQYFGAFLTSVHKPAAYNWDGTSDETANLALANDTYGVMQIRHNGTTLQARLNTGAWQNVASGATTSLAGAVIIGLEGTTGLITAHFVHGVIHNTVLSDAAANFERNWAINEIGNFSLSTIDPYYAYVTMLFHFDGTNGSTTFTESRNGYTIGVGGNAQLTTADKVFGTASLLLDGTGDYISQNSTAAASHFDQNNFTIEGWVRRASTSGLMTVSSQIQQFSGSSYDGHQWYFSGTGMSFNGYDNNTGVSVSSTFTVDTSWHYYSVSRQGGVIYLHRDGVLVGSGAAMACGTPGTALRIGIDWDAASNALNGKIDDLRYTVGVGRYDASTYTVPALAHPDV
jgi:hypothetical protein